MNLPPTDEETALLEKELRHVVDNDRFILSPRIRTLQAILNKIRREPLPPMRHKSRRPKADTADDDEKKFLRSIGLIGVDDRVEVVYGR